MVSSIFRMLVQKIAIAEYTESIKLGIDHERLTSITW